MGKIVLEARVEIEGRTFLIAVKTGGEQFNFGWELGEEMEIDGAPGLLGIEGYIPAGSTKGPKTIHDAYLAATVAMLNYCEHVSATGDRLRAAR